MSLASLSSFPKTTQLAREEVGCKHNQQTLQPRLSLKVIASCHLDYFNSLQRISLLQSTPHTAAGVIFTEHRSGDAIPLLKAH